MAPVRDRAIILQTFPYSESSVILRLLTRRHGVRSAIAKGARRTRSRVGGRLEPFNEGEVTLYLKKGRDLQTLAGFDADRRRHALGRDLLRFGGAALLAEIVIRTGSEEAQPELFDHVQAALDRIAAEDADTLEPALLAEAWALIGRLGFSPALEACLSCGRTVDPDAASAFDYRAGGVRCDACPAGEGTRRLPAHARRALLALSRGEAVAIERTAAHWQLVDRFLRYHVLEGAALRSMTFLSQALETP